MRGGERFLPLCPPFLPSVRDSASRAGPLPRLGSASGPDCPLAAPPPRSAVPRTPTPALRGLPSPFSGGYGKGLGSNRERRLHPGGFQARRGCGLRADPTILPPASSHPLASAARP